MQTVVSEIQVSYHNQALFQSQKPLVDSKSVADLLYHSWNKDAIGLHESFKVLLLNNNNKVNGIFELSRGGISGTVVDIRILFAVTLKSLSVAMILAHNHPSGTLRPSEADKQITQKIKKAAEFFDIRVLDHIILSPLEEDYFSFADNGIL
ncbi:JAB domain-containing protein [Maribacter litopenaei]|uniref:JAB domain-containing protein n=1 Tax=Maribacter litopenaei TaxID=2976127 RepID=A0ABY5Y5K6_9FLAO|nr:JAB domain-containing protein [Maribacter litopenaei]UWX54298.1 JAB domain-containing protein [Maribacter litopenaei]